MCVCVCVHAHVWVYVCVCVCVCVCVLYTFFYRQCKEHCSLAWKKCFTIIVVGAAAVVLDGFVVV